MSDKVDTRIALDLDPDVYREMDGYEQHAQFVGCVVDAVNDAFVTLQELHEARKLADANPGWTPEQRTLNVGRKADEQKLRVLKKIDLAERDLGANIKHTENLLSEPLTEKAGAGTLNGEVRAHAARLDRPKRSAFIQEALTSDDELTLAAILGAPPYLSGLTKIDQDHYLRLYHAKRNPQLIARLDTMQRFRAKLDGIGPTLHRQFDRAVGEKLSVVAAMRAADDRATAALNIQPKP